MPQSFTKNMLQVKLYPNRELLGIAAANEVAEQIRVLIASQGFVNIIFAAAPSQIEFLEALATETGISWNLVNAFHMDEYIGLEKNAPQAFLSFLKKNLFDKINFGSVYPIDGNANDSNVECKRYTALLRKYPPDIVCMGIGENGHIAFNDPHVADFKDPQMVKLIDLDQVSRQQQVNDNCFGHINEVPTGAITLTIPALMQAKYIYCMVPGINKSKAIYNTLHQSITELYPSTILRRHEQAVLYIDEDSAKLMDNEPSNHQT